MAKMVIGLTVLAALAGSIACGGNGSMGSPSAPSPAIGTGPQALSSTASQSGALDKGKSGSANPGQGTTKPDDSKPGSTKPDEGKPGNGNANEKVELEGVIASVAVGTIVVGSTSVTIPAGVVIRHGDTRLGPADLKVGQRVHVAGTRSGAGVVAAEIMVQTDQPAESAVETISGAVAGLKGTCPAVTFTIAGTTMSTSSVTTFSDSTCGELANGMTVTVRGARQGDGSISAFQVKAEDADVEGAQVEGVVAGLAGTCPAITFAVGTTKVSTDATTLFQDGVCGQVANGTRVSAKGTAQADGSIQATRVAIEDQSGDSESR